MPDPRALLHQGDGGWVCDLCGQQLAGPDDRCNSGLHQGPDDMNGFRGSPIAAGSSDAFEHLEFAPSMENRDAAFSLGPPEVAHSDDPIVHGRRWRAELSKVQGLWQDEALITALFEAHTRGDVRSILKEALNA